VQTFNAYLTSQAGKSVKTELVDMNHDQLYPGEVVMRIEYSTVNYKDALSASGAKQSVYMLIA
jgi:acrylyl-CoA reductase (NADPH)